MFTIWKIIFGISIKGGIRTIKQNTSESSCKPFEIGAKVWIKSSADVFWRQNNEKCCLTPKKKKHSWIVKGYHEVSNGRKLFVVLEAYGEEITVRLGDIDAEEDMGIDVLDESVFHKFNYQNKEAGTKLFFKHDAQCYYEFTPSTTTKVLKVFSSLLFI